MKEMNETFNERYTCHIQYTAVEAALTPAIGRTVLENRAAFTECFKAAPVMMTENVIRSEST